MFRLRVFQLKNPLMNNFMNILFAVSIMRELPREERGRKSLTKHSYNETSYCSYSLSQPRGVSPSSTSRGRSSERCTKLNIQQPYYTSLSALTKPKRPNKPMDQEEDEKENENDAEERSDIEEQRTVRISLPIESLNSKKTTEELLEDRRLSYSKTKPSNSGKPVSKQTIEKEYTHDISASYLQLLNEQLYCSYDYESVDKNGEWTINDASYIDAAIELRRLRNKNTTKTNDNVSSLPSTPTKSDSPKMKKSFSSGLSNFFRKLSPKTARRSLPRNSSEPDPDSDTSTSSKKIKKPSPIRRFFSPTRANKTKNNPQNSSDNARTSRILKSIGDNASNLNGNGFYHSFKEKQSTSSEALSTKNQALKAVDLQSPTDGANYRVTVDGEQKKPESLPTKDSLKTGHKKMLWDNMSRDSIGQCSLDVTKSK
ncbi:unnamed protein product [Dimorphilus gyrociliatus]|uniref:Uncharacterized protein n=1 Tax=Dimorphilus gyrociliatus TaxID=2664684 RepID=A0A7I8W247_9ANNE|nr:unnamed protein product [Dimorphilus gyrociliatus]